MMTTDEEKRWVVVGVAMMKVVAPALRDFIKQKMTTHYANLDAYCSSRVTLPCTLKTLNYRHVASDPSFQKLKFQNINTNLQRHARNKKLYNYRVNSPVDLAKLYLPDYLAEFSAFDESMDLSAILRLLGFSHPSPLFLSPNPLISIQSSADDIRESVRNNWVTAM